MSEAAITELTHEDIVKKVFIDPIRTVLVIDDEFPTLDGLIAKELGEESAFTAGRTEITQVRQILDFARSKERPWLVDVHDGRKVSSAAEKGIVPYLHHSDLMVLDFHLEGDNKDGSAAIEILRKLAANDHFNMVILYTKGDAQGAISEVLRQIALSLSYSDILFDISAEAVKAAKNTIEEYQELNQNFTKDLFGFVDDFMYLKTMERFPCKLTSVFGTPEGKVLSDLLDKKKSEGERVDRENLLKYIFDEKRKSLLAQLSKINLGQIKINQDEECCWISTEKLFLTILSKGKCAPDQFEKKLQQAISSSYPSPHRFLITKMRAEIDQKGLIAEASILRDKAVQVAWLNDFLNPNPADVTSVISATVTRHWEAMGDHLKSDLQEFGATLRSHYKNDFIKDVMEKCGLQIASLKEDATLKRYNSFISTKPFDRSHLTTGHTFRIKHSDSGRYEDWICLSPACDMVPGQKSKGWNERLGDSSPFIAVRLFKVSERSAVESASRNTYLFLDIADSVETFSIYQEGNIGNIPEWEQMFATNQARFRDGNKLSLFTIGTNENALAMIPFEAEITAQLRTEYALNLLQRVGSMLSRPGLGMHFKSRPA